MFLVFFVQALHVTFKEFSNYRSVAGWGPNALSYIPSLFVSNSGIDPTFRSHWQASAHAMFALMEQIMCGNTYDECIFSGVKLGKKPCDVAGVGALKDAINNILQLRHAEQKAVNDAVHTLADIDMETQ